MSDRPQFYNSKNDKNEGHGGMGGVLAGGGFFNRALPIGRDPDSEMLNRALAILHRFGTENMGWRSFFRRWYYSDEPLRNDAANLVREARFNMMMPNDTRLVGDIPDLVGPQDNRHE